MPTIRELEPQVLALPESERAELAAVLLSSLPPLMSDHDDGVAEALRREAKAEADPDALLTRNQFEAAVRPQRNK